MSGTDDPSGYSFLHDPFRYDGPVKLSARGVEGLAPMTLVAASSNTFRGKNGMIEPTAHLPRKRVPHLDDHIALFACVNVRPSGGELIAA